MNICAVIADTIKICLGILARGVQRLLFFFPVRKNRILFDPYTHPGYAGNPKYVAEWLLRSHPGEYELIWVSSNPASCEDAREKGILVIPRKSMRHLFFHFTARTIVYSDMLYLPLARRRKQVYIQVWHGGINYKRIGLSSLSYTRWTQGALFRLQNAPPDVFVSSSAYFTDNTSSSFGFPMEIFLPSGTPRNDVFFADPDALAMRVRERLRVSPAVRIALYAPTFRSDLEAEDHALDTEGLRKCLSIRFGGEWLLLLRYHGFIAPQAHAEPLSWVDVSAYPDMQELLCAADVLISDYSSCMWDYSFLLRPTFVYAPDMDAYANTDRGFALPPERWPYRIARSNAELQQNILAHDASLFSARIHAHHEELGSYEAGNAAEKVVAWLMDRAQNP